MTTQPSASPQAAAAPSQSAADAERDGVLPELASVSFDDRVSQLGLNVNRSRVTIDEGVWIASQQARSSYGESVLGDRSGEYARDFINLIEYGEVLLLNANSSAILRAFPLPGMPPQQLLVTEDAVYCAGQGDGGLPDSMLCRIDRESFALTGRLFPSALGGSGHGTHRLEGQDNWTINEHVENLFGLLMDAGDAIVTFSRHETEGRELAAYDGVTLAPLEDGAVDTEVLFGFVRQVDGPSRASSWIRPRCCTATTPTRRTSRTAATTAAYPTTTTSKTTTMT